MPPVYYSGFRPPSGERGEGRLRSCLTLLGVLLLHLALLAALVLASRTRVGAWTAPAQPVELMFLAPVRPPPILARNIRPRLQGTAAPTIAPPLFDSPAVAPTASPGTSGAAGSESGVDWQAEARRALQAFEIRNHQPPSTNWVSGPSNEDPGLPRAAHHAGERVKTANGDWIVWINSNCYQIASAAAPTHAPGVALSRTVCSADTPAPQGRATAAQ